MASGRPCWWGLAVVVAAPLQCQDPPGGGVGAPQQGPSQGQPPQDQPQQGQPEQPAQEKPAQEKPGRKPLQWQVGDYTLKLGGYLKVDLIYDFDEIGSENQFDPRTIPTNDETNKGTNALMQASTSRINLDVRGPTDIGPVRMFVEGDFFGSGNSFRLRHAFGVIQGVLAGQTWSTFMDEDAMPETLDFETPIAYPLVRQAMIRYTHDLGDGSYAAVALEDPDSEVIPPAGVTGETENATPDLTGRLRWAHGLGHTQLSLFAGSARFRPDTAPPDTVGLWGLNLSTKLAVYERDQVYAQVTYGPGVARYRGGITAAPDADGDLQAVTVLGALVGYEHHWSDELRSTVCYSWADARLPGGVPATATEVVEYFAANLIWQFCDRAWFGIEYLRGARETFDDARGEADRLQASIRFDF